MSERTGGLHPRVFPLLPHQRALLLKKTPPDGVVVSMIFGIENHGNPSHYDLHIENFNSCELKFSIEYQYNY